MTFNDTFKLRHRHIRGTRADQPDDNNPDGITAREPCQRVHNSTLGDLHLHGVVPKSESRFATVVGGGCRPEHDVAGARSF
jgi:hypothetical protein